MLIQNSKTSIVKGEKLASETLNTLTTQANNIQQTIIKVNHFAQETLPTLA